MKRLVTALCAVALTTAVAGGAFACPYQAAKAAQTDVKGS